MKYKTHKSGEKKVMRIEGDLVIQNADKLKQALLKTIQEADHVSVNLDNVTELDLTCLQLLCSAHRTCESTKKRLSLFHPLPEAVHQLIKDTGFYRDMGCEWNREKSCLWMYKKEETDSAS